MAMYLTVYKKIDILIVDMIQRDLLSDAEQLVRLYYIVHPPTSSRISDQLKISDDPQKLILLFAKQDARQGGVIELALQAYNEAHTSQSQTSTG